MPADVSPPPSPPAHLIFSALRWAVALQCVANWRRLTQIQETPLLNWMLDPHDVGGLGWSEATALAVQAIVGWPLLPIALLIAWKPHRWALLLPIAFQIVDAIAMWRIAEGYTLLADWLPLWLLTLFPFATHLLRIAAPLALFVLCSERGSPVTDKPRISATMQFLRWSAAIVFVAHGIEALQHNPRFVDLIISSAQRVLDLSVDESTATSFLTVIGTVDLVSALACVAMRSPLVMQWLALWGGITALSRIVAYGWGLGWHEALTRAPHFAAPLAVALWWRVLKSDSDMTTDNNENNQAN